MKKVPSKKRFRRCRERTFTLSGPVALLAQAESYLHNIKALGHISRLPETPPRVVKRKNGTWETVAVVSSHPQNDFEVRTYRYTKPKPVEQALLIVNASTHTCNKTLRLPACGLAKMTLSSTRMKATRRPTRVIPHPTKATRRHNHFPL